MGSRIDPAGYTIISIPHHEVDHMIMSRLAEDHTPNIRCHKAYQTPKVKCILLSQNFNLSLCVLD